jgi:uncharacterized protein YigA (DUF484 family)
MNRSNQRDVPEDLQRQLALKESQLDAALAKCQCLGARIDLMQTSIDNPPIVQQLKSLHSRILSADLPDFGRLLNDIFSALSLMPIDVQLERKKARRFSLARQPSIAVPLSPDIEMLIGSMRNGHSEMAVTDLMEKATTIKNLFQKREAQIEGMAVLIRSQHETVQKMSGKTPGKLPRKKPFK